MTDIGDGTPLICVKYTRHPDAVSYSPDLTVGALYTCAKVCRSRRGGRCLWDDCGDIGVAVIGKDRWLYCPNFFRPLNDGDTSLVENEKTIDNDDSDGSTAPQRKETEDA